MDFSGRLAKLLETKDNDACGAEEITELAEKIFADAPPDAALSASLMQLVRDWHIAGCAEQQERICAVIARQDNASRIAGEALHLLGFHAQARGDFAQAKTYYTQALARRDDAFSRLALAQLRMMLSEFTEGLDDYEARFDAVTTGSGADWRGLPYPRWRGENLAGKHLYLWAEQGLGDVVMFATLLPRLIAMKPARIALGMYEKLMPVFTRSFPDIAVENLNDAGLHALGPTVAASFPKIEEFASLAAAPFSLAPLRAAYEYTQAHGLFDYVAPMGDLLCCAMQGHGAVKQVLAADAAKTATIKTELQTKANGKLTGISWATSNVREAGRNLPLEEWLPLLRLQGRHFVSLQHGVPRETIDAFCAHNHCSITIVDTIDLLQDAESLFALIAAMDDVVTIDNSNVHIAGALGIPTVLLLPKGHNYRWPLKNKENFWYQSVNVICQAGNGDWKPVIAEAAKYLLHKY